MYKNRIEKVGVYSFNLDFDKKKNGKEFFYGYELSIEGILKEIETGEYDDISQRLHASGRRN